MLSILNIIILAIFVLLAFFIFRVEHIGKKVKIIIFIIVGLLLYLSIMNLFSSASVDLTSPKGVVNAVYVYFGWLGQTASNIWDVGVETTGKVIDAVQFNKTDESSKR